MKNNLMKLIKLFGLILLLQHNSFIVFSENYFRTSYNYTLYSVNDGLPETLCWGIFQDSKGFIWVATYGGFACYDGQKFIPFWNKNEVNVLDVTENENGTICALTFWDYALLADFQDSISLSPEQNQWRLITHAGRNLPPGYAFFEDRKAKEIALIATSDTGLIEVWKNDHLSEMEYFRKPYWDQEKKLFYIPTREKIYVINDDNIMLDSLEINNIHCVVPDQEILWLVSETGIYKYIDKKIEVICKYNFPFDEMIGINAVLDKEGNLFIQTDDEVFRFNGTSLESIFKGTPVFEMLVDREGSLWLATYDGIYNMFRLQFKNYVLTDENDIARSILSDKNNNVWVATINGNLYKINENNQHKENFPSIQDLTYFQGVPCVSGNDMFFPGYYNSGNILKYDNHQWKWLSNLPSLPYNYCVSLPDNNILLISYLAAIICSPQGEVIKRYDLDDLMQQPVCGIVGDDGIIRIGGSSGISLISGDSIFLINNRNQETFRNIAKDQYGRIWATTQNRLCRIEGDSIPTIYSFNDVIRCVYFTKDNILLVGTLKGIYIKTDDNDDFIYYDKDNGFAEEKLIRGNMIEDEDGNIWLLSSKKLIQFNPKELLKKQASPLIHLLSMQSSTDNISWQKVNDIQKLNHSNRNIKFSYLGLCYSATQNIRYQYRLLGFQDEWSVPVTEKEITFNNLFPGDYTFEVKAILSTNETEIESYTFTIIPAIWQRWWFILTIIFCLIVTVVIIVYLIIKKKKEKEIKQLEREKMLNLLKINSIRLRSIPHFNANVLAGIEYYIMNSSKEKANEYLSKYSNFTNITLKDVDKPARSLKEEVNYVSLYLDMEKLRFVNKLDYCIEIDDKVDDNILIPNMILHTHCENAMKHGLRHKKGVGKIMVTVENVNEGVCIIIEDNGIGRNAAREKKTTGSGEGLKILSQQIELYNQSNKHTISQQIIDLLDEENNAVGTRIQIYIPYEFYYF
ncbi:histidine kinase [Odoribacter sp. OttesenSCG-928-L07]|nr:histidine kinase [Odoribacter sp. OttesenSCG-928-L07]MDL2238997.1 histidine kinase [Bacteroidales bacterium OttesenSCG-928-L14]MDL2240715.1 histidine kinase [Bacteroidales bacterium OttesenSCG-928-K22]